LGFIGGFEFAPYRQIAPAPSDALEAKIFICALVERQAGRLEKLLAEHKAIDAAEALERYDRAALDGSPEYERFRFAGTVASEDGVAVNPKSAIQNRVGERTPHAPLVFAAASWESGWLA